MQTLICTETAPGLTEIRRTESELPFALLKAPRHHRNGTRWQIHYRNPELPDGFSPEPNACPPTESAAHYELHRAVKGATDYQLGLAPA
jgi:hypothetical protein